MASIQPDYESFSEYYRRRFTDKKEFLKLFYEVLRMSAIERKGLTHIEVFSMLNDLSLQETGKYRFKDYGSFLITKIRLDNVIARKKLLNFKGLLN